VGKITIIAVRRGQDPVVEEMESGLKPMQDFVGGYIDTLQLGQGVDLWCNDEGLYTEQPNRLVTTAYGHRTPIHGDFFLASHDAEGETVSLSDEQIAEWLPKVTDFPESLSSVAIRFAN